MLDACVYIHNLDDVSPFARFADDKSMTVIDQPDFAGFLVLFELDLKVGLLNFG
jgi:hypothetical protein